MLAVTACQAADVTFYSYGDPHYGVDGGAGTGWVHRINALAGTTYPAAFGGGTVAPARGVMALGDLINDGGNLALGTNEWAAWKADYGVNGEGVCRYPVYECFGNHDLNASRFVQKDIIARNLMRTNLTAVSTNGLHYSWDWDGVHFVTLGVYPADTWTPENTYSAIHDPEYALSFLRWDLENNVGDSGRPVVLMHHFDFFTEWWPDWQKLAYARELDGYNVVLILHGHQGAAYQYDFQGCTVSGENGSLNVVHITSNNTIQAAQSTGSNTWGNTLQKTFTMPDLGRAWNPLPRNGARNAAVDTPSLSWRTGADVVSQDVYFGTSSGVVAAAVSPHIAGLAAGVTNVAIPPAFLPLEPATEYFWRVDQANGDKPFSKGKVWSFRTRDAVRTNDITLFFASDIHYQDETLTANKRLVTAMDSIPGAPYPAAIGGTVATPRGVVFGGDAASDAKQWQYSMYLADYGLTGDKRLEYPVAGENNGNHDGGLGSIVGNGIVARNNARTSLTALSSSGLQTSWDWDGVHFVTLGVRPGVNTNPYNSHGSLEFLIDDLATHAGNDGRPVVLFQHFGVDDYAATWWTDAERTRYYNAIRNYNVIAIFHGHTHLVSMYPWQGIDVYHAPHMQFGGSVTVPVTSSQGFYAIHITSNRLAVAERKADGSWGLSTNKPFFRSYAESGLAAVVNNGTGASNIVADRATLTGTLVYEAPAAAPTSASIFWGPTDGGTNVQAWSNEVAVGTVTPGDFHAAIAGLAAERTYYYRCTASNGAGLTWTTVTAAFTSGEAVAVDNGAGATAVSFTTATLNGNLLATLADPTDVRIFWGPTDGGTQPTAWSNTIPLDGRSTGAFSSAVTDLSPETRYYYRCFATNAAGDGWADTTASFLTLSPRPQVTNAGATAITRLGAVLNGVLVSTGAAPTRVFVCWGPTDGGTNAAAWTNVVDTGEHEAGPVALPVTGLAPDQAYRFRCLASNAYGTAWAGTSTVFRTLANSGTTFLWDGGDTNASPADWRNVTNWVGDAGYPDGAGQAAWFTNKNFVFDHQVLRLGGTITLGEIRFVGATDGPTKKYVDAFGQTNDTVVFATADSGDAEFGYETCGDPRMLIFQANMVLSNSLHYVNYQNRNGAGILGLISGPGALRIERYHGAQDCDFLLGRAGDPPNTYQGGTTLSCGSTGNRAGTFNVKKNGAFGSGDVTIGEHEIVVLEDRGAADDMIDDQAALYLRHSGTNLARMVLNGGVTETVGSLYLYNDTTGVWEAQATGTWGAASSSAGHVDDAYFGSNGVLVVSGAGSCTITAGHGDHGVVQPTGQVQVARGGTQAFSLHPDPHFHLADLVVDGISQGACDSYAFSNVTANHSLLASFAPNMATNRTPEWWLAAHDLTNGTWDARALDDPDHDGLTTWQEWHSDTDPTNGLSRLYLGEIRFEDGRPRLRWTGGRQATQYLESATALGGPWQAIVTGTPPTAIEGDAIDAGATNGCQFYRIRAGR